VLRRYNALASNVLSATKSALFIGWGDCETLDSGDAGVFAHRCTWEQGGVAIAVHNLSDRARTDVGSERASG
jgi:hypothetical protein